MINLAYKTLLTCLSIVFKLEAIDAVWEITWPSMNTMLQ